MPNDYKTVHKQRVASGEAKQPENKSKIVVEGIDTPKPPPERPYQTVIDPWSKDYPYAAGHKEMVSKT